MHFAGENKKRLLNLFRSLTLKTGAITV